ncbi:hypothetical protein AK812_SmicGene10860 [Symbiodinium microadriaticum]|uniref:Uncharacterized protein n=1 Tax=Symbiodinium microadriaticum TaxID=2951 RepID=A0A1Q9EET7_SYMMI|nr:hypothetical protein AK812_SmicGene10860 [Symbiodinium microadriaticum]
MDLSIMNGNHQICSIEWGMNLAAFNKCTAAEVASGPEVNQPVCDEDIMKARVEQAVAETGFKFVEIGAEKWIGDLFAAHVYAGFPVALSEQPADLHKPVESAPSLHVGSERIAYLIAYMPRPRGHCIVSDASSADALARIYAQEIVALPLKTKLWMVFAIKIPTIIIEIALLIAGMKFLMYCNALGPLIMKALGMAYIKTIPDIVFGGLSSKPFQAEVDKTSLVARVPFLPAWDTWVSGAAKIVLHVSLALWYCRVYHGALQDFRMACFQYKYQFVFPTCHCGLSFFGMRGWGETVRLLAEQPELGVRSRNGALNSLVKQPMLRDVLSQVLLGRTPPDLVEIAALENIAQPWELCMVLVAQNP